MIGGKTEVAKADFGNIEKLALWVGSEHAGLSEAAQSAAAVTVRFPMNGFVESLNVSVATALVLYEVVRQREASGKDWKLDTGEAETLAKEWVER